MTLQKKIGIIVLSGLAVGLSAFSWAGIQSVQKSVARTLDERLTMARVLASHLDGTLSFVTNNIQDVNLKALPAHAEFVSSAARLSQALAKARITVRNVILVNSQGTILDAEPAKPESLGLLLTYPALKQTLEKGLPAISGLELSLVADAPVVFASSPVVDGQGKILGAVIGSIDLQQSDNDAFRPSVTAGKTGYVEIIDGNGVILARTARPSPAGTLEKSDHPVRFAELINQQKATVGTCHRCHETSAEVERERDILAFAPLSTVSWGVAIRQSEDEALAPTRELEQKFLLLGVIIVISLCLLVWLMMREIVNPVRSLTTAAKRIAAGDFKAAIATGRRDEIGQLSTAFHTMTRELAKSRDELVSRNDELSALNRIVATVSESLNMEEVLSNALRRVLEVTRTETGQVFLRKSESELQPVRDISPSAIFQCQEAASPAADCVCHQVLRSGQTMLANHVSQCPKLGEAASTRISFFVSIPLKSKSRTLGIMNIAGSGDRVFTSSDFRLLDSIGYQVGLAIENSILYEETRQKEELRGQLLSRVISAQEEERKRVARELHDEYGQVMTGLIMSIESLESTIPPDEPQAREKLAHAKSLAERALDNLRRLTLDLRPSVLDDLGLVAAVRAYARSRLEPAGVEIEFEASGLKQRLNPVMETALFRILQEAIHNVGKHAEAHMVRISLEASNGSITAIVQDDGKGFDPEVVARSKMGSQSLGLLGIKERATLLGGTLNIKSAIGQGTCLTVEVPVIRQHEPADA